MKHKTNIKSCFVRNCLTNLEKEWASVWIFLSKLLFIVLQRKTTKISFFVLEWKPKKITFFVLKRKKRSFWHVFERNILKTNVLKYSQTIYSILVLSQKTNVPIPSFKHPVMTVGSPKMGIWYLLHRIKFNLKENWKKNISEVMWNYLLFL